MPNKNLKYLLNPIINLTTMSNRLTLIPSTSTTPQANTSANPTQSLNNRKVDIHPDVKKGIIVRACYEITQYNTSLTPISCKSNLQSRELVQSENINKFVLDLEETTNDPDPKIKIFLLNLLIKVLSTPGLHIKAQNIAFYNFNNLLIHSISCNHYPFDLILAAATQCLHIIGSTYKSALANHEESKAIPDQCIKLIKALYKKWDNSSKLKFLENNLDYFADDISKAADTLYLYLILKSHNIKKSITNTIIDTIKSFSTHSLLSHIKVMLTENISKCTDDALLTCNEKIVYCDKLIIRNASLSNQQRRKLEKLLKDLMTQRLRPEDSYFRNDILSSDKFRSLLLTPRANNNTRTTALDIITHFAKQGDKKEKTTIHSLLLDYLLSYTSKNKTTAQLNLFCERERFATAQDITTIITLSTSLHEYNTYLYSFITAFEILSLVLASLSNPDLEAFTILKFLGMNPELKTFLKTSFNN